MLKEDAKRKNGAYLEVASGMSSVDGQREDVSGTSFAVIVLLLLFIEGSPCVVGGAADMPVELLLVPLILLALVLLLLLTFPLSHFHNVTWLAPPVLISSIPASIIPFNDASTLVELV